jgi:glycosyltransferase involved in cell wall biosynthesis
LKLVKRRFKNGYETGLLFGFLPIFMVRVKKPVFDENTFFVWEPCSSNHAEVVPGFAKYLLDLGYKVSVLYSPVESNEGLFSRFENNSNLIVNKLTKKEAKKFFKYYGIENAKGIMITTGGVERDEQYEFTSKKLPHQRVLKVEHSATVFDYIPNGEKIITLRKMNYNGATTVEVNPHYFGKVEITQKNSDITNFIVIGALRANRRNTDMLVAAVQELQEKGFENFKITVVGKGSIKHFPTSLHKYFDIKGRLNFSDMYKEMEKADFFLPLLDVENKEHENTITTSTSGSFQLIYGFKTPAVMAEKFANVNGFTDKNSILYEGNEDLSKAMQKAIKMTPEEYTLLQDDLANFTKSLYNRSRENLRKLIDNE